MDPKTIGAWIGIILAAGGVIAGTVKFLFWAFDEWQKRRTHQGFSAPKETLRIATKPEGNCWWSMGKRRDDPTMQIVGSVFITNISSIPVRVPRVELRHSFLGRKRVSGMVMVSRSWLENMYGLYDIPPNETRDATFDFWVYPPVLEANKPFTAYAVSFFDQFGNEHKMRRVLFEVHSKPSAPPLDQSEEFPYEIDDPIEKEVVSVLKAEIARYQMCGRSVGGLGSIYLVYKDKAFTGFGGDSWTINSPVNQLIVSDPEAASVKSDNLEALIEFYRRLASDDERARFVAALLNRLDAKKSYLGVSYFIVCVLWSIGSLPDALRKASHSFPTGEDKLYGLSNALMLLNGLLKYRHPDFTNEMLDEIERMLRNLNEHPFLIPQKIAAIRASRLANPKL